MREVTIRDYIGHAKELTAEQVRKLAPGTHITRHSFDRYGAHKTLDMCVVQAGRSKMLAYEDNFDLTAYKKVQQETDRMCYTEVDAR
jgi:hypothetical protein